MAYADVPQDLSAVKPKAVGGLTKKQLISALCSVAMGLPIFFLTRIWVGNTVAVFIMMLVMLPVLVFGLYEKDGKSAEYYIKKYVRHMKMPKTRPHKTMNIYKYLESEDIINEERKAKSKPSPANKRKVPAKSKTNNARKAGRH